MSKERVIGVMRRLLNHETLGDNMSPELRQAWDEDVLRARAQTAMDATAEEGVRMSLDEALEQVADFDQNDTMEGNERTGPINPISNNDAK